MGDARSRFANADDYIANVLMPKYPNQYIAIVHEEEARLAFKGWIPLKVDYAKDELIPVKGFDEAEKRKAKSVLCWCDRRIQNMREKEQAARQRDMDGKVAMQSEETITSELNQNFQKMGFKGIKATVNSPDNN
jgi:hypothetical protein